MKPSHHKLFFLLLGTIFCLLSCGSEQDQLNAEYQNKKGSYPIRTRHLDESGEPLFINKLVKQRSAYLLQHAHNPVNWQSWGDEAFAMAKKTGKPILLSIGYSTCHWCHVMERESFEDLEIADYINQHYIAIKVDREERPAVDEIYIAAVQNLSGKAGWPLTAVLTPDAQPFFGGTYFGPEKFLSLLKRIHATWEEKPEAIMEQAERVMFALNEINRSSKAAKKIDSNLIATAQEKISEGLEFSATRGASAFPREPEMLFVLEQAVRNIGINNNSRVQDRLSNIANGGIHDQIGGGFHRYTVDDSWQIPHFEKMLYNQAQLGEAFLLSYLLSGDVRHKLIADSTFDFMLAAMQSEDGGFYAAMDAESEGREGSYYTWAAPQLMSTLNPEQLQLATEVYGISPQGNFENRNVLQFKAENVAGRVEQVRELQKALSQAREDRPHPRVDKKIITAWNSIAISALITAYQVTKEERYLVASKRAAERIWASAYDSRYGLARTAPMVGRNADAVLEDYAYFSKAMLDLYDVTANERWLQRSEQLVVEMIDRFLDDKIGAFRTSSVTVQNKLIVDMITARDDALVSGNSMAAQAITALYFRTGDVEYRRTANKLLAFFSEQIQNQPQSLSGLLNAASSLVRGEIGKVQYLAKGKVKVDSEIVDQQLEVKVIIAKGWHINANPVLEKDLIATSLLPIDSYCPSIKQGQYPTGKLVQLGFQADQLSVYEGSVDIIAPINDEFLNQSEKGACKLVVAELRIQACSDEVCLEPENVQIRAARL